MWDALGLPFLKFSSSYRLISMLFIEKNRLKSKNLNRSRVGKFWAKLFKKPTKCRNGALSQSGASTVCRSANQNQVILPSIEGKLRKNALCLNQSAFSNFALYVIKRVIQRHELLSFLDARINMLKAKHFLSVRAFLKPMTDRAPWKNFFYAQMFVLAEFLFDFPFKNFSLFWPLFWELFETHSSTFLAFSLYQSKKRANRSFKRTESIFIWEWKKGRCQI